MIEVTSSQVVYRGPNGEPLIQKTPGVCGGDACIRTSRIMVWLLVNMKKQGATDNEIFEAYPTVSPQDLAAACAYYGLHPEEIEESIRLNDALDD